MMSTCTTLATSMTGLLDWLVKNGSIVSEKIEFKNSLACGNTLGCFAKADFCSGEILFAIHLSCIVSVRQVVESPLHSIILKECAENQYLHELMTLELCIWLYMIEEKSRQGHFATYLNSLSAISPCPFSWPEDLVQALSGTNILPFCTEETFISPLEAIKILNKLHPDIFPLDLYNVSALKWAKGHYISRRYPNKYSHGIDVDISQYTREAYLDTVGALVPLLDILNHKSGEILLDFEVVGDLFYVKTNIDIIAAEEIFSNYGTLSNEKLLYAYGYAEDNNENDAVTLKLMAKGDLGQNGADSHHQGTFYVYRGGFEGVPEELWRALIQLSREDGDGGEVAEREEEEEGSALEIDIEDIAILKDCMANKLRTLTQHDASVRAILSKYGIQEDGSVSPGADYRAASIAYYREGQRHIVKAALADLQDMLDRTSDTASDA